MSSSVPEDDTYVIHGPPSIVPVNEHPLGKEIMLNFAQRPKDSIAMIDAFTHRKLLYSELLQESVNLATVLRHHGYQGQEAVFAISSENCLEFFVPILATHLNGSIMAPLNHAYTPYELEHVLQISCPKIVFCAENLARKFLDLKKKFGFIQRIIVLSTNQYDLSHPDVESLEQFTQKVLRGSNVDINKFKPVDGDANKMIALIMCSSGTTGLPKGVATSHRNIMVLLSHRRDTRYQNVDPECILGIMPFYHGYGHLVTFTALLIGKTIICLKKFDEDTFLRCIQDYRITMLPLAPPLAIFLSKTDKLKNYDLSSVKSIVCGAAPLSKTTEEEVKRRLNCTNMRQAYGLSEMTLAVTYLEDKDAIKAGSCGKPVPHISAKVRDPETGRSLGPNKVGELCWKGPLRMMGYYKNEQATKDMMTSDGWLKSGDLGYYDEDGYFYIIDRLKELIKYKGFQVAPAELEALLVNHPKIKDAGVVGLPDELTGEKPLALVVRKEGMQIGEEEIKKYVAGLVSPQKRLTGGVIFVESIPKNASGKILRRQLREMIKEYRNGSVKSKL